VPPRDHFADLSPDERLRLLAAVLARGVLRLITPAAGASPPAEKLQKSAENWLEVPPGSRLSVHTGFPGETPES